MIRRVFEADHRCVRTICNIVINITIPELPFIITPVPYKVDSGTIGGSGVIDADTIPDYIVMPGRSTGILEKAITGTLVFIGKAILYQGICHASVKIKPASVLRTF